MDDRGRDHAKLISAAAAILLVVLVSFVVGLYSGVTRNSLSRATLPLFETVRSVFLEAPNILGAEPIHFLQPARGSGAGVTINERDDDRLVAISGFFDGQNGVRLMRRDGTILAQWTMSFTQNFPDTTFLEERVPQTDWNVDTHGMVMNPDGSVVVNYEYAGTVKLDRCGKTVWTLDHPTHHSVEKAEGGGYWIPGLRLLRPERMEDSFPPLSSMSDIAYYLDNLITKVSEDGEIVEQKSVTRIMYDNGMEPFLTAIGASFYYWGRWNEEFVHLNKIVELPSSMAAAFPEFSAGDLMISIREHNMVLVVDPKTWRVKWHQTGPWKRQHDPEFNPDGTITVFNNNIYRNVLEANDVSPVDIPRVSEIIRMDPKTREWSVAWGNQPGQEMLTVIRGKQEPHEDGSFLVTEFEGGRAFETDGTGKIVWEYINRYDESRIAEITEARSYPSSYFTVSDWSCPNS